MTRKKTGRNDACPCGSGKKYKHCCLKRDRAPSAPYTQADREAAEARLAQAIDALEEADGDEMEAALDDFMPELLDEEGEEETQADELVDQLFDDWLAFDRPWKGGATPAEVAAEGASRGARAWLQQMQAARLRVWEVAALAPGRSLTLRDLLTGREVTVREVLGSRNLHRWDLMACRVVARGKSGQPEIEGHAVALPRHERTSILEFLEATRGDLMSRDTGEAAAAFDRLVPALVAEILVASFARPLPDLRTPEGDPIQPTKVHFDISDPDRLRAALAGRVDLVPGNEPDHWSWLAPGEGRGGLDRSLGVVRVHGGRLVLETVSAPRADRGRALLESLAGDAVTWRATEHEDFKRLVEERRREGGPPEENSSSELPPEVVAQVLAEQYERHYRAWIDDSIPALGGASPREAVKVAATRPQVVELLRGLDNLYHRALDRGEYGYDPSWLWRELGLEDERGLGAPPDHPPPLAHEVLEEQVPGIGVFARQLAARIRERPDFTDEQTANQASLENDVPLVRYLEEHAKAAYARGDDPDSAASDANVLAAWLHLLSNWELHRRKTFWVADSLAWALNQTNLDLPGSDLRMPFPAFALVFTDRPTLSLAERLLARQPGCSLHGDLLRSATVYVVRADKALPHALTLGFCFDAGGDDWPYLLARELWIEPDRQLEDLVASHPPDLTAPEAIYDAPETRALVRQALNAILYATSAHVEPVPRAPPRPAPPGPSRPSRPMTREEVLFLPGHIDIQQARRLAEVESSPSGRELMHRFMVRGHWRRANPSWKDPRPRWIEPYWKGPDLATILERQYRLKGEASATP